MADIRCPMCGKPNPADRVTCQYCQARLKPLAASPENPSADMPPSQGKPGSDDNGGIPDWLSSLRSAQGGSSSPAAPGTDQPASSPQNPEETPDWLSRIQDRPPEPPPAPFESVSAVSDWLNRFDPPAPAKNPPEDEPDWLDAIRRRSVTEDPSHPLGSPSRPETPPAAPSPDADWLQSLRQAPLDADSPDQPAAEDAPAAGDDWLSRIGGMQSSPQAEPAAPEGLPDWLMDVTEKPAEETPPAAPMAPFSEGTARPAADEETPDWMKSLEPRYPAPPPPPARTELPPSLPPHPAEPPSAEFAEFLKNASRMDEPLPDSGFYTPPPVLPAAQPESDDLPGWSTGPMPDWLSALEAKAGAPPSFGGDASSVPPLIEQASSTPVEQRSADPFISGALPDWLGELGTAERSSDSSSQQSGAFIESETSDSIESADLPSWVQALRPVETVAPKTPLQAGIPSEARMEDSGPLAGLRGILPAEPGMNTSIGKTPAVSTHLEISEQQEHHSQILENLLASEGLAEELPAAPAISNQRILRVAIAGILLVALLIPLVTGIQIFPAPISAPAEVTDLQSNLSTLPVDAPVLLVADYTPAVSGEMQAAASGVLIDLLKKGARLTVISTNPTGPVLADRLLVSLIPADDPSYLAYRDGEKVVHLGYLPGGTTALAAFAADPQTAAPFTVDNQFAWERPALQGVHAITDFARVIVLTENANTGQAWIEQVQPQLGAASAMLVIAGAQAAPSLRPYLGSRQVQGMVAGVAEGAAYEELAGRPGAGRVYWDAFQFGTWAAVLIILIGALSVFVRPALDAIRKGEGS